MGVFYLKLLECNALLTFKKNVNVAISTNSAQPIEMLATLAEQWRCTRTGLPNGRGPMIFNAPYAKSLFFRPLYFARS